ncbi:hypothetical protein Ahy_A03g010438 [Arachis hypogaea]|uniref:Uncharacterized protein n=1 Tax=Arachis hypogaea TaxID=3818 RepID=A0A445DM40_ARAHY|nr:hypothetical protein Ahy_A03g010438 [Arachis hypogaea]
MIVAWIWDISEGVTITRGFDVVFVSNLRYTLFIPEEIKRINLGLHMCQPIEVVLEILLTPNASLLIACVAINVIDPNVKISIVDICSSRGL